MIEESQTFWGIILTFWYLFFGKQFKKICTCLKLLKDTYKAFKSSYLANTGHSIIGLQHFPLTKGDFLWYIIIITPRLCYCDRVLLRLTPGGSAWSASVGPCLFPKRTRCWDYLEVFSQRKRVPTNLQMKSNSVHKQLWLHHFSGYV